MRSKTAGKAGGIWVLMPVILVLWGSFAAVSKLTLSGMDSFQLQFWMFGVAFVGMTLSLIIRGRLGTVFHILPKQFAALLLCGALYYSYYFLYTLSMRQIPAVEASMLNYLFPVMIVLFAIPIHHEKLTPMKALSIFFGFVGTLVILTGGKLSGLNLTNAAGDLLALGAAVAWGIFSNLGKWNDCDMEISVWYYVLISFALSSINLFCFSRFRLPGLLPLAGAVWLSLSNVWLSLPLWLKVLKTAPTALVAGFTFITPFVTLLFILLLTGEPVKLSQGMGLVIIMVAIIVQNIRIKTPHTPLIREDVTRR